MKRVLAVLCAASMLYAQTALAPPYQLVVVRGDNAQNNIKKGRATRQVVEVRDRNKKPVAGVLLTFSLPKTGASGTFVDGSQMTTVTTDSAGQASVSVQPNSVAGNYQIDVTGNVGGEPVSGKISQSNLASAGVSAAKVGILAAVAAGAAVGIGLAVANNGGSSSSTAQTPGVRIGVGSGVTINPPR